MGIWLVMRTANGRERPFRVNDRMTIGRETRCHLRIAVPSVSDRHCELLVEKGEKRVLRLVDLDSGPGHSGTYHNGSRVREAVLSHSDTLKVGPVTFEVRFEPATDDGNSSARSISTAEAKVIAPRVPDRLGGDGTHPESRQPMKRDGLLADEG